MPQGQQAIRRTGATSKQRVQIAEQKVQHRRFASKAAQIARMPTESWWLQVDQFYDVAKQEAKRMTGSRS